MTATSSLFGQAHTQSLSFSGPSAIDITTTNTFTLTVNVTFSGYSSPGFSYWLDVQSALDKELLPAVQKLAGQAGVLHAGLCSGLPVLVR